MDVLIPKVLVVDDELNILKTMGIAFDAIGFDVRLFSRPQDVIEILPKEHFDLAFVDLKMTPIDGLELLQEIKRHSPSTTVTIVTAHGSIDSAIEAVRNGAYHYLQKPFDLKELQLFAQKAWEHHQLSEEVRQLKSQLGDLQTTNEFVTRNRDTLAQLDLAAKVAESDLTVLIEGESGTGKEMLARFIHQRSGRSSKPFMSVNCAAIPDQLLESELFGHVRGAFTGAIKDRQGRFELADGGTIFLDEIAELPLSLQPKLLRVLQSRQFERVGESTPTTVDVRVIAATNRNIDESLKEGTFRDDLFYRLNSVRLKLLPLRERPGDIPLLVQSFIERFSTETPLSVDPQAMAALKAYRWSGNARELENVIRRAIVLSKKGTIQLSDLPDEVRSSLETPSSTLSLEEVEKIHIKKVLQHARDFEEAASLLGIDPATLWRKRKKFGL